MTKGLDDGVSVACTTCGVAVGPADLLGFANCSSTLPSLLTRRQDEHVARLLDPRALVSFLQPIIRLADGTVYGYEALLRGHLDDRLVLPAELWRLARDTGSLARLECLARLAAIRAKARFVPDGCKLFINVSPSTLLNDDGCMEHALAVAQAWGVPLSDLAFEIVETEPLRQPAQLRARLDGLRARGIAIALDDFGAAYASMQTLATLPFDYLKLDRSLVQGVAHDPVKARIMAMVVALGHDLGLTLIAEGVETAEDLAAVRLAGFDLAQGYYLGSPQRGPSARWPHAAAV